MKLVFIKGAALSEYLWEVPMVLNTIMLLEVLPLKMTMNFPIKVCSLLRVSFLVIFVGAFSLFILSQFIVITLYGDEYQMSISVLKILLPGVVLFTILKVLNMDLAGKGKPLVSVKAMVPALIINIVFNYFLIPKYGADGASLSSAISYSFAATLFLFL